MRTSEPERSKPRVLIIAHTTTFLTELSLFGKLVRTRTDAETVFYCPFVHWTADAFAKSCASEGVTCLLHPVNESLDRCFPGTSDLGPTRPSMGDKVVRRITTLLARAAAALPGIGPSFVAERIAFEGLTTEIGNLLHRVNPRLLVLGGDMAGYDTALYIKLAHEAGIAVLIVPSTMSNGREQAEVYYADPSYHVTGWARQLVASLFPKWVRRHRDTRLFRCPPGRLLAMELAGLAPPQPWIFNSGYADAIAMESEAMIDYYASAGMKHDRMVLTGSLSDDSMAERMRRTDTIRRDLCRDLNLDPAWPIVLTAVPPDFLYMTGGRPQCDFKTYDELLDFWIGSHAQLKECNNVIALHPSIDAESMRKFERDNIRIGRWRTADMVPACDIYVASISSTIRWAIACGKPVVNYDVYRYRYTDFLNVPGVLAMEEQQEFRSTLTRLVLDDGYRRGIAQRQASVASQWGLLDGRVGDRMLALVERLAAIPSRSPNEFVGVVERVPNA
jgi:hypothetical protein